MIEASDVVNVGAHSLVYGRQWRALSVGIAVASFIVSVALPLNMRDADRLRGIICLGAVFASLNVPLLLDVFGTKIDWDSQTIRTQSPWRRRRTISRDAIVACDFSIWWQWYRVRTDGFGTIRVHKYMDGIASFLESLPCSSPPYPPPVTFREAANKSKNRSAGLETSGHKPDIDSAM